MWVDPNNKSRFYTGSDGGVTLTHDGGQTWLLFKNINVTQYYMLAVDMRDPYYVCGGLQDAGTSCGPSLTRSRGIYLGTLRGFKRAYGNTRQGRASSGLLTLSRSH